LSGSQAATDKPVKDRVSDIIKAGIAKLACGDGRHEAATSYPSCAEINKRSKARGDNAKSGIAGLFKITPLRTLQKKGPLLRTKSAGEH
ncbi:MAG TPA: hypothetical protein VLZ84_07835, partial [Asticcacaulis sp.]|nr:hypothetical protein [Asticcacaulis sp.]